MKTARLSIVVGLALASGLLMPPAAQARNIVSTACKSEILVAKHGDFRLYIYCLDPSVRSTCRVLGPQRWFKLKDLNDRQSVEQLNMVLNGGVAFAGDALGAVGVALVPGSAGMSLLVSVPSFSIATSYTVKSYRRYRDARILDDAMADEAEVNQDCNDFDDYALQLEDILNRI